MIKTKTAELKSMSQQLRSILYLRWSNSDTLQSFEQFYRNEMNIIIHTQKQKLT